MDCSKCNYCSDEGICTLYNINTNNEEYDLPCSYFSLRQWFGDLLRIKL